MRDSKPARSRRFLLWLGLALLAPVRPVSAGGELIVHVLRGANTLNNAVSGVSTTPAVLVTTPSGAPVAGALVIFTAPTSGPSIDFAGSGGTAHTFTDDSGTATAPGIKPVAADGQVEIGVRATKQGLSGMAAILEMNLGTETPGEAQESVEIVQLPETASLRMLRYRVESRSGNPLSGAKVLIAVTALRKSGKMEAIEQVSVVSGADGVAAPALRSNPGHDAVEITVRAAWNGLTGTRYFSRPASDTQNR